MSKLRRDVGFWPSLTRQSIGSVFLAPEFLWALLIGGAGGVLLVSVSTLRDRQEVAGDLLVVIGPLLGIVFAALALVVSFMSDRYLRLLHEHPEGGLRKFLGPFMVAVGLQVGALILAVAYRAGSSHLPSDVPVLEEGFFVALSFLFLWAVLDVVALARNVMAHALTRARADQAEQGEVRRLPTRRSNGTEGPGDS